MIYDGYDSVCSLCTLSPFIAWFMRIQTPIGDMLYCIELNTPHYFPIDFTGIDSVLRQDKLPQDRMF